MNKCATRLIIGRLVGFVCNRNAGQSRRWFAERHHQTKSLPSGFPRRSRSACESSDCLGLANKNPSIILRLPAERSLQFAHHPWSSLKAIRTQWTPKSRLVFKNSCFEVVGVRRQRHDQPQEHQGRQRDQKPKDPIHTFLQSPSGCLEVGQPHDVAYGERALIRSYSNSRQTRLGIIAASRRGNQTTRAATAPSLRQDRPRIG
jgi:hypothetical protein